MSGSEQFGISEKKKKSESIAAFSKTEAYHLSCNRKCSKPLHLTRVERLLPNLVPMFEKKKKKKNMEKVTFFQSWAVRSAVIV